MTALNFTPTKSGFRVMDLIKGKLLGTVNAGIFKPRRDVVLDSVTVGRIAAFMRELV